MADTHLDKLHGLMIDAVRNGNHQSVIDRLGQDLHSLDVRFHLLYASSLLATGRALDAFLALKSHYVAYSQNEYYAFLYSVAASAAIKQLSDISETLCEGLARERTTLAQLEFYLDRMLSHGLSPNKTIKTLYGTKKPADIRGSLDPRSGSPALFHAEQSSRSQAQVVKIPPAPTFYENIRSEQASISVGCTVDVDAYSFSEIQNATLYMLPNMEGLVQRMDGSFVAHSRAGSLNPHSNEYARLFGQHVYLDYERLEKRAAQHRTRQGRHILPFRLAGAYYYHFLHETLPAIYRASIVDSDAIVLLPQSESFYKRINRSVHDGGIDRIRTSKQSILPLDEGVYRFESLLIPNRWLYCDHAAFDSIESKGESFKACDIPLYISRRNAPNRRLINEDIILGVLRDKYRAVDLVNLEQMTFKEQKALFETRTTIISPHGGGLSNLVFSKPGTKVIEIHPVGATHAFWHTSFLRQLKYNAYIPAGSGDYNSDFMVSKTKFAEFLDVI